MQEKSIENEMREQVIDFLSSLSLFQPLDKVALQDLINSMSLIHINGGTTLIHEGEKERSLYILWRGRLRVYRNGTMNAEISVGEIVGEIALLTGAPRTATVQAIRDSILIKLDHEKFQRFEKVHPEGVTQIAKTAIKRLIAKRRPIQPGENIVTIAIAPAGDSNHAPFLRRLVKELNKVEPTILVNKEVCNQHFNRDVAQAKSDDPDNILINNWLSELEGKYRFIVYETDHQKTPWTDHCLRQADVIFLVAEEQKQLKNNRIEEEIFSHAFEKIARDTVMVFVHPDGTKLIKGTHYWLQTRPVQSYHHIQLGSEGDFARLIRFMTGKAFGLVLNGGGMRGFAHVGVLKALEELKIPIDYIGGCSIGAAIAGTYARIGLEESLQFCYMKDLPRTSTDYTFPAVALLKGKNICDFYQKMFGDDYIEDLKTPFFCVSSDLTHSKLHVHNKGILWKAVRASTSIPAIYPPMYTEEGGMLVDGALMNNMPVDVMRKFLGGGKILAVDCNIEPLGENKIIKDPCLSGWKLFFLSLFPFYKKRIEYDNIFKIIRTSIMFSSEKNQGDMKSDADYLIEIETRQFGVLRLQGMDEIIELGYQSAMKQLPAQLEKLKG